EAKIWPHMFYMSYQDIWRWKMNVARVMGNSRDEKYIPDLIRAYKENSDERVLGMVVWAIGNIGGPGALTALKGFDDENNDLVKEEIRLAKESS
ncbi:MAG: HEAT repeat domain-containing protein, partial [Desulfobacterales bacterium]|nr:HEAT repeat domain-containing protein [Desulfobacterales bacterium]